MAIYFYQSRTFSLLRHAKLRSPIFGDILIFFANILVAVSGKAKESSFSFVCDLYSRTGEILLAISGMAKESYFSYDMFPLFPYFEAARAKDQTCCRDSKLRRSLNLMCDRADRLRHENC